LPVELRSGFLRPGKGDPLFPAGSKAGPALRTGGVGQGGQGSADQADVDNLGAGAGVGAIGHGDPELVVQLERAGDPALHEFLQLLRAQQGLKPLGKILPGVDAVGAAALPEAGLQGKALYFVLLVVQVALPAGRDMCQRYPDGAGLLRLALHPFSHALADEKRHLGHRLFRILVPLHGSPLGVIFCQG